eukprot:3131641-Pleurochrysis_carterae.AAC.1
MAACVCYVVRASATSEATADFAGRIVRPALAAEVSNLGSDEMTSALYLHIFRARMPKTTGLPHCIEHCRCRCCTRFHQVLSRRTSQ